jgi:Uri superfamily endonuclease
MATKGTYILFFEIPRTREVEVGKLGRFSFHQGLYAYVGSAMNGLEKRVARHMAGKKRLRWHIDHLTSVGQARMALLFLDEKAPECELNLRVESLSTFPHPVRGFGSSDCRCRSHLHRLTEEDLTSMLDQLDHDGIFLP